VNTLHATPCVSCAAIGAGVGQGPAEAEDRRADKVPALGARRLERHRLPGEQRAGAARAQEAKPEQADRDRRGHHQVEVGVLQQQHRADPVGVAELPPGDQEAEGGPQ
jgi:hypothetical protein